MRLILVSAFAATVCAQVPVPRTTTMGKGRGVRHNAERVENAPDRAEAWLDWSEANLARLADDTYATGLNPIWYGYGSDPLPAGAPMPDREKLGFATISKSYQYATQNIDNQIERLYHSDEFDHDAYDSLQLQRSSAASNGMAAALEFIDIGYDHAAPTFWWLGYKYAADDARLALDIAYDDGDHDDIYNAHRSYTAASYWDAASLLDLLEGTGDFTPSHSNVPGILFTMATAADLDNARIDYDDAEHAYYEDPSRATAHELEIAEINLQAAQSGMLWGLAQGIDGTNRINTALDGYLPAWAYWNQWDLVSQASDLEAHHATQVYYDHFGSSPYHDEHEYGLHHAYYYIY